MIKISKASNHEDLNRDWRRFTQLHYGKDAVWTEKAFKFKAVEDGKLVGTLDGKYETGVVTIAALMVAENARGRGIGKKLIEKAESFGKKLGAHRSWLLTGESWTNRQFYEKLGFKPAGKLTDFYYHQDFVIYTRPIK